MSKDLEASFLRNLIVRKEYLLVLAMIGMNSEAIAKGSGRPQKKSAGKSESVDGSDRRRSMADVNDDVDAENEDSVDRRPAASPFLAIGVGLGLKSSMTVDKDFSFANGLATTATKVTYALANAPAFSLEACSSSAERFGICIGGYYDQPKKIASFTLEDSSKSYTVGSSFESEFSQYGGMINASFSGKLPYAYLGVNYGAGELTFKGSDNDPIKYGGALGGQFGFGIKIGDFLAVEASYKKVSFTKEENQTLADVTTNISMVSTLAMVKFLLH